MHVNEPTVSRQDFDEVFNALSRFQPVQVKLDWEIPYPRLAFQAAASGTTKAKKWKKQHDSVVTFRSKSTLETVQLLQGVSEEFSTQAREMLTSSLNFRYRNGNIMPYEDFVMGRSSTQEHALLRGLYADSFKQDKDEYRHVVEVFEDRYYGMPRLIEVHPTKASRSDSRGEIRGNAFAVKSDKVDCEMKSIQIATLSPQIRRPELSPTEALYMITCPFVHVSEIKETLERARNLSANTRKSPLWMPTHWPITAPSQFAVLPKYTIKRLSR